MFSYTWRVQYHSILLVRNQIKEYFNNNATELIGNYFENTWLCWIWNKAMSICKKYQLRNIHWLYLLFCMHIIRSSLVQGSVKIGIWKYKHKSSVILLFKVSIQFCKFDSGFYLFFYNTNNFQTTTIIDIRSFRCQI